LNGRVDDICRDVAPLPGRQRAWKPAFMNKQIIIDAIRQCNPTATYQFLGRFGTQELEDYLRRLTCLAGRRGRDTAWVRHRKTPVAIGRAA